MAMKKQDLDSSSIFKLLAEKVKTQAVTPNMHAYVPHDKQQVFHKSLSKKRLYIGGNRSGKTTGGVIEDLWWCTGRHPYRPIPDEPIRGRVVSVDFINGIQKIILPEIKRWCPLSDLKGGSWETAYDKLERTLTFKNGSFIEFMSYDQDLDKFAGTSRHFIHFDEEPPKDIYTENTARLVDTGGSFWITMTPVEGMTWVYDTLYEPGSNGESNIHVVEVSMTDNPHLDLEAVEEFLGGLDDDERKAREHGQFVQLGGLIYKSFNPPRGDQRTSTHVVPSFSPPKDWTLVASLDHGFNNPTAVLYHAIGPDGQLVTFKEHYKSQWTIAQHAARIHEINKEIGRTPDYYIGDPSIRNTDPITGTSIQQEYIKHGIPIVLANNDVSAGIIRVAGYMRPNQVTGRPLWVCTVDCPELIRELSRYRWKVYASKRIANENNAQETPHKKDDHAADSLRYFIMSRPELIADPQPSDPTKQNWLGAPSAGGGVVLAGKQGVFQPGEIAPSNQGFNRDYNATQWKLQELDDQLGGEW